jgi:hypothetical protein
MARLGIGQMRIGSTFQVGGYLIPDSAGAGVAFPIKEEEAGSSSVSRAKAAMDKIRERLLLEDDEILTIIKAFVLSRK